MVSALFGPTPPPFGDTTNTGRVPQGKPGTDSEFPANCAGNSCQSPVCGASLASLPKNGFSTHTAGAYALYGIEAHYDDGRARVYLVDRGTDLLVMGSEFTPNPVASQQRTA